MGSIPTPGTTPAAQRGKPLFAKNFQGVYAGVDGTDNNGNKLHAPEETGMDAATTWRNT